MEENFSKYIIEFQKDNYSSFDEFYSLVKNKVFYNILSLTNNYELSEDLLQETFVKFLESVKRIEPDNNVLGFLMVSSRNLTLDYFRKKNRLQQVEFDDNMDFISEDSIEEHGNEILDQIRNILKPKELEIFMLHVMSELTFKEIAKLKNRPLGTILWSYNNAIKKIRKELNYEGF